MQQGQQLQFQALQAFLETSSGSGSGSKRAGDQPEPTGTVVSTFKPLVAGNPDEVGGSGVGDPKDEAGALAGGIIGDPKLMSDGSKALDEEIRHFVQYFGYSVKEMERFSTAPNQSRLMLRIERC